MTTLEDQARSIFLAALDCAPDRWLALVDEACSGNAQLRERVNQLLHAHQASGSIHGGPAAIGTIDEPITEHPGMVIGPYKLMEQIGEGGMGLVFVAEQQRPVRRKVALKVIKPGMDTRQVVARFEAERQALALMDHPNIAKVLDGGETASGRPYFVMELVKGVPITEYCDQNQVPVRERLGLVLSVCEAVQHAHQKGIIHRDIKPSNVLVMSQDGTPVVKVIDFGVAKAVGQQLTDKTIYTQFCQLVGTPLYMAPEQAGHSGIDVDTRTDIYALGVLLYELLTGTTPFAKERLKGADYDEIRRIIREEEPLRPSMRISTLGQAATTISTRRKSDPRRLTQLVRGELDWIVMKALEKDRNRRYESASAFASDVKRYLNDETVSAGPPSAWYRFRKFARRNKGRLGVAVGVLAVVLGLAAAALVAFVRIDAALEQAKHNANLEHKAREEAEYNLYLQMLARVQREREAGNIGLAEQLLDDLRFRHLHDWGWHYLKGLRYGSLPPLRHSSCMCGLALSPDGRFLAAGGSDGRVKLWNTQTWEEVGGGFQAHGLHVHRVAFSPSGRHLATASWDGTVKIWDVATCRMLHILQHAEHGEEIVGSVVFSPDGSWIASGGSDSVKIWDAVTGERQRTLPGNADAEQGLALSPDGRRLAFAKDMARTVQLWDTASWTVCRTLKRHNALVIGLAFSADGTQLAAACGQFMWTGGPGEVAVWDVASGQRVHSLPGHVSGAFAVAFTPDGRYLASGGVEDGLIKLWDLKTGREVLTLRGHRDSVWGLAFSPDGQRLYSAGHDQTVRAWDATPLAERGPPGVRTLRGHTRPVTTVAFSPDRRRVVSGSMDGTIRVWDAVTGRWIRTLTGHRGPVRGLAFRPYGRLLASVSQAPLESPDAGGDVKLWDTNTWQEIPGPDLKDDMFGVAFRSDGKRLAAVQVETVMVWDMATCKPVCTLQPEYPFTLTCVAFGSEGRIASSGVDGSVQVWDRSARQEIGLFAPLVLPPGITSLAHIWRATTEVPTRVLLRAHQSRAMCVAFSPDGAYLASAGLDEKVKLWDARTYRSVGRPLRGHRGHVNSLAFRPDGKRLASAGSDAVVRIWDVAARREVLTLSGHTDAIYALAFSPDGRYVASGGWDGTVMLWDMELLPEARRRPAAGPDE
jgi:WD40 repeat protein/serine/threonine protein kinase